MARSNQSSRGSNPGTNLLITVNLLVFLIALGSNFSTGLCGVRVLRQTNVAGGIDLSTETTTISSTNLTSVDMDDTTKAMSNTTMLSTPGVSVESPAPTTTDTMNSTLPGTLTNVTVANVSSTEPTLTSPLAPETKETQPMNSTEAPTTAAPIETPTASSSETAANASSIATTPTATSAMTPTPATNATTDSSDESTAQPKPDPGHAEGAGSTISYNLMFLIVSFALASF